MQWRHYVPFRSVTAPPVAAVAGGARAARSRSIASTVSDRWWLARPAACTMGTTTVQQHAAEETCTAVRFCGSTAVNRAFFSIFQVLLALQRRILTPARRGYTASGRYYALLP